jgi:hypothetical protein
MLIFGVSGSFLYVWARLNPRAYDGELKPRLGMLVSGGALDALEGET